MANLVYASLAIGILVIIVLFLFGLKVQRNNIWLIGYIIALGYSCWIGHLMQTNEIFDLPHFIRTGTICGYLIVPMLFLYVRCTCYPGRIWRNWYWVMFIPSIFFIIDLIPFWSLPAERKAVIFEESMRTLSSLHAFSEGWISPRGFHFTFRMVWSFFWFSAIIVLIYRNRQLIAKPSSEGNKHVFRFMSGLTLISLPFLIAHLAINLFFSQSYTLSNFTFLLALPLLLAGFYLMMFPSVVYGLRPAATYLSTKSETDISKNTDEVSLENLSSTNDPVRGQELAYAQYTAELLDFMEKEKPFLNQRLSIHDLAEASEIPAYVISTLVNKNFGLSFNNWLNTYRIEFFKELILKPEARSFTMESLGKESGFGSRVTLINAFKKQTGLTPSQYLRQYSKTNWPEPD